MAFPFAFALPFGPAVAFDLGWAMIFPTGAVGCTLKIFVLPMGVRNLLSLDTSPLGETKKPSCAWVCDTKAHGRTCHPGPVCVATQPATPVPTRATCVPSRFREHSVIPGLVGRRNCRAE